MVWPCRGGEWQRQQHTCSFCLRRFSSESFCSKAPRGRGLGRLVGAPNYSMVHDRGKRCSRGLLQALQYSLRRPRLTSHFSHGNFSAPCHSVPIILIINDVRPGWRNWQTRTLEGRMGLPWGFKSPSRHQFYTTPRRLSPAGRGSSLSVRLFPLAG